MESWFFLFFPALLILLVARLEEAKNPAGESPPPDSDPFSDVEFGKKSRRLSSKLAASANRRLEFQKRSQLFIRTHNEAFSSSRCGICNTDWRGFRDC
jgi:hypothetical protein